MNGMEEIFYLRYKGWESGGNRKLLLEYRI